MINEMKNAVVLWVRVDEVNTLYA